MEVATRYTRDRPLPLIVLVNCFSLFSFICLTLIVLWINTCFLTFLRWCLHGRCCSVQTESLWKVICLLWSFLINDFSFQSWIVPFKLIIHFARFHKVTRHGKTLGNRTVAGRVVKESYGAAKQQHTFTVSLKFAAISYMKKSPVLLLGLLFGHT